MRRILLAEENRKFSPDTDKLNALQLYLEYIKLGELEDEEVHKHVEARIEWYRKASNVREEAQRICQHEWGETQRIRDSKIRSREYHTCTVCEKREEIRVIFPNRDVALRSMRRRLRELKRAIDDPYTSEGERLDLRNRYRVLWNQKENLKRGR